MCIGMANGGKTPNEMTPQEVYDRLYARYVGSCTNTDIKE